MPVTLRKRKISRNRYSLYADAGNAPTGKRFQSLGLYIDEKPRDKISREHNKEILAIAGQIVRRKENELSKPEIYSHQELEALKRAEKANCSFVDFCNSQIGKIQGDSYRVYKTALKYFLLFLGLEDIKFGAINLLMVDEFREYLPTAKKLRSEDKISQNSAATYMGAFKGMLVDAYKAGFLSEDYGRMVEGLNTAEANREFLSQDELARLYNTACQYPGLKEMALFSAMTGLRFSDCHKLNRQDIRMGECGWLLHLSQKKTNEDMLHPISDEAYQLMEGVQGKNPFADIDYNNIQRPLKKWLADAGITKHITFHSFRHSYASMLLDNSVDLFTVSQLLGHKSLRSTQVYTHIKESRKVEAANKINLNLQTKAYPLPEKI